MSGIRDRLTFQDAARFRIENHKVLTVAKMPSYHRLLACYRYSFHESISPFYFCMSQFFIIVVL
jgi:hypothetical protein